jgi:hypothetical protein
MGNTANSVIENTTDWMDSKKEEDPYYSENYFPTAPEKSQDSTQSNTSSGGGSANDFTGSAQFNDSQSKGGVGLY